MRRIKVSTPGKLMLFGEHAVIYDRPCIVAAVDQRFEVTVQQLADNRQEIIVEAPGVGMKYYRKSLAELDSRRTPKGIRFVEAVVKRFFEKHKNGGLYIKTENHFSCEYGFGSSAAVTVGLAKALHQLYLIKVTDRQLFDFCYQVVLEVQGVGSGFDIAAALYGGCLYFVTGGKKIVPMFSGSLPITRSDRDDKADEESLSALSSLPTVVGYTGVKADTPTLVRQVAELKRHHPIKVSRLFDQISEIVEQAKRALVEEDWQQAGELMDKNQMLLDELGVSSVELDRLIKAAKEAGALGAKLSGAGGGDCMVALVGRQTRAMVERAIKQAGGKVLKVKLGAEGARIEK
jgi:mevalonate kinase